MAFGETSTWVIASYIIVFVLALVMSMLGYRSYRASGNERLLFVVVGFLVFALKALLITINEFTPGVHYLSHHQALSFGGLMDVIIVLLIFVPFVAPRRS